MTQPTTAMQDVLQKANYVDASNDSPGLYGNPLILNRVFELLVIMINSLQRVAAAQAGRLNFLTAWQKAYTEKLNQIHAFVSNNGDNTPNFIDVPISDAHDTDSASRRSDLNAKNTSYTQQMQGNNGVISNDAKALQSVINQTNDAVQSQTDIATSILQQMSTILSSIYQTA